MNCNSCEKPFNAKCIKCSCGYSIEFYRYIYFDCLYNTYIYIYIYILPNDYTNISQSKYANHILSSQYFKIT